MSWSDTGCTHDWTQIQDNEVSCLLCSLHKYRTVRMMNEVDAERNGDNETYRCSFLLSTFIVSNRTHHGCQMNWSHSFIFTKGTFWEYKSHLVPMVSMLSYLPQDVSSHSLLLLWRFWSLLTYCSVFYWKCVLLQNHISHGHFSLSQAFAQAH